MKPRITEAMWLAAGSVIALDLHRTAPGRHRKRRLFGVACCRRALKLAPDARLDRLVDTAERFADGDATWEDMKSARRVLQAVRRELGERFGPDEAKRCILTALDDATVKTPSGAFGVEQARYAFAALSRPDFDAGCDKEEREQVALAREIFGNPFRPVTADPRWLTSAAVELARAIYAGRVFDRLPLLADALQEAGCEDVEILGHLRGDGPHVRGCWGLDVVLGKE